MFFNLSHNSTLAFNLRFDITRHHFTDFGVNLGTMGPRDVSQPGMVQFLEGYKKPAYGVYCAAVPRNT